MEFELHSHMKVVHAIAPAVYTATEVGAIIDTAGFESLEFVVHVGTALVGGGFNVLLEEGDDPALSDAAAVASGETLGALPVLVATDADKVFRVGSIGKKRYQRLTLTETGTVSAGVVGALAVLGHAKEGPVADQST